MSGEIEADIADAYRQARKKVESEVNRLLAEVSIAEKAKEWAFIAIIRKDDSPDYGEVVKKSSQGKEFEFRLKIPHAQFLAANPGQRVGLIFKALSRSVDLMGQLGVSTGTQKALREVLFRAENQTGVAGNGQQSGG
jgi:hypothetical protein